MPGHRRPLERHRHPPRQPFATSECTSAPRSLHGPYGTTAHRHLPDCCCAAAADDAGDDADDDGDDDDDDDDAYGGH
eukprot:12223800-Alexandrium_andersonii.AAC.1